MTLNIKTSAAVTLNFDTVQCLRDLEDTTLSLGAYCKASLGVLEVLRKTSHADSRGAGSFNPYRSQLLGCIENVSVLTDRIRNTIDLVSFRARPQVACTLS